MANSSVSGHITVRCGRTGCIKMIGAVWKSIIFTSTMKKLTNTSKDERVTLQVYDTCLQMFPFFGLRRKDCLIRSTFSSDTRGRPALFTLQRHPIVWNCWYRSLMLLGIFLYKGKSNFLKLLIPASNAIGRWGITVELSPECPLNKNNWFVLPKLQHTKRLLLRSRHYRFVTSQTDREEGSGIAHAHKTWTHAVSFHVGNLLLRAFNSRSGRLKPLQSFWYALYNCGSYNESQRDALFLKFILAKNSIYFGQIYCPSWGVSTLYTQQYE
jgi:hypothetical protein